MTYINQLSGKETININQSTRRGGNIGKETININQSTRWERNHQHPSVNQVGKKPPTSISQPGGNETININQSTNQVGKKPPSSINQLTNQDSDQSMH